MEAIADKSLEELQAIYIWVNKREAELPNPITVLVGGWAVYSYNRYWGSIDIDLITNNKTRRSMRYYLLNERGYRSDPISSYSVYKDTDAGEVIIDFANRKKMDFEGRRGAFKHSIIDGRTEMRRIGNQDIPVPSRSVLLMMKFKAAWDRTWRLQNNRSKNKEREEGKLIKDYSDILALLDPKEGGENIDVMLLGGYFSDYQFLRPVIDQVSASRPAAEKYGIAHDEAFQIIKRFKDLVL
jgi:hypothetical protein